VDFAAFLTEKRDLINNTLNNLLPDPETKPSVLYQAMRYSVFAGGKRLRPILFLSTVEALKKEISPLVPFACALELIHTYSLIHDDLPAMDNADYRRGLPTCHKKFGEAQVILTGDALLTYAFNLMINTRDGFHHPDLLLTAINEVAYGAGIRGMVIGQVVDIESENKNIDLAELKYIHAHKTGALFRASVRAGGILAEAKEHELQALTGYAEEMGLAFQITDDILDVIGSEEKLGKPIGSDVKNRKATYPALLGLDQSHVMAKEAVQKAINCLDIFGNSADSLREMAKSILAREN